MTTTATETVEQEEPAGLKEREVVAMELATIIGRPVLPAKQAAWYAGMSRYTLLSLARDQEIPTQSRNQGW